MSPRWWNDYTLGIGGQPGQHGEVSSLNAGGGATSTFFGFIQ